MSHAKQTLGFIVGSIILLTLLGALGKSIEEFFIHLIVAFLVIAIAYEGGKRE